LAVADAKRVKRPKLPEKRLFKKSRKTKSRSQHAFDGAEKAETKPRSRKSRFKFCPRCGSTNIFWASGLAQLWSIWQCRNCGYRGAFIVEDGEMAKMVQQEYLRKTMKP
jgi:predicted RNA-binding Zn-ribbon protein involved in translation (DUF1610 family)